MRTLLIVCVSGLAFLAGEASSQAGAPNTNSPQSTIPYVPTRHDAVRDLLWLADVGTNDVVYDLGSGDGRVVIAAVRDFHARKAVGVEIKPELIQQSRENAAKAGVSRRVEFIRGDLFTEDVSQATVVVLYLGQGANLDLRERLVRTLKPGARIVSHQFGMGEWAPDKSLDVRTVFLGMVGSIIQPRVNSSEVPDAGLYSSLGGDVICTWIVPAPVAGVWRGKVSTASGERELKLTLHQQLSKVTGTVHLEGSAQPEAQVLADLWGDHLRFHSMVILGTRFDGHIHGDTMDGAMELSERISHPLTHWTARREKADFTGTWEWTEPTHSAWQLMIERREGRLIATYADSKQTVAARDFYDFGGGFYFTLLLGIQGDSYTSSTRRMGPDDGWLIGEGVATNNALTGKIAFFPYEGSGPYINLMPDSSSRTNALRSPQTSWHDWQPTRVTR